MLMPLDFFDFCVRLTELKQRSIFHALYRRAWELREELDVLHRYIVFKSQPNVNKTCDTPAAIALPLTVLRARNSFAAGLYHLGRGNVLVTL